jgi:CHAT domain-containing protein
MVADVAREQRFLEQHFPGGLTVLSGADAAVAAVHAAMASHRLIHLSCHGYQDLRDPSAAGLELSDGTLTITRLSGTRYAGDLAFLSACRTAAGGVDLPDEVITLAAAFSYAGYRHVIATLWSVNPSVAADVTTAVYGSLIADGGFDPDQSAAALHAAVRALRDGDAALNQWLPFIHAGA